MDPWSKTSLSTAKQLKLDRFSSPNLSASTVNQIFALRRGGSDFEGEAARLSKIPTRFREHKLTVAQLESGIPGPRERTIIDLRLRYVGRPLPEIMTFGCRPNLERRLMQ